MRKTEVAGAQGDPGKHNVRKAEALGLREKAEASVRNKSPKR